MAQPTDSSPRPVGCPTLHNPIALRGQALSRSGFPARVRPIRFDPTRVGLEPLTFEWPSPIPAQRASKGPAGEPSPRVGLVSDRCGHRAGNASVRARKGPTDSRGLGLSPTRGSHAACRSGRRPGPRTRRTVGRPAGSTGRRPGPGYSSHDPPGSAGFVWRAFVATGRRAGFVLPAGIAAGAGRGFVGPDGLAIRRGGRGIEEGAPSPIRIPRQLLSPAPRLPARSLPPLPSRSPGYPLPSASDRSPVRPVPSPSPGPPLPSAQDGRAVRPLRAGSALSPRGPSQPASGRSPARPVRRVRARPRRPDPPRPRHPGGA